MLAMPVLAVAVLLLRRPVLARGRPCATLPVAGIAMRISFEFRAGTAVRHRAGETRAFGAGAHGRPMRWTSFPGCSAGRLMTWLTPSTSIAAAIIVATSVLMRPSRSPERARPLALRPCCRGGVAAMPSC